MPEATVFYYASWWLLSQYLLHPPEYIHTLPENMVSSSVLEFYIYFLNILKIDMSADMTAWCINQIGWKLISNIIQWLIVLLFYVGEDWAGYILLLFFCLGLIFLLQFEHALFPRTGMSPTSQKHRKVEALIQFSVSTHSAACYLCCSFNKPPSHSDSCVIPRLQY